MTRLLSTFRCDVTIQFRSGFYYASAFFVVVWAALLSLPEKGAVDFGLLIPAFMLLNLAVMAFYFMGALVLLEKSQGTLAGLVVTPLRKEEYLLSKIGSLALMGLIENLVLTALVNGLDFNLPLFVVGLLLLAAFCVLLGFIAIARYDSINEFLLPSVVMVSALMLPLIDYLGLWHSPLFYLHPAYPPLLLMRAAFGSGDMWQLLYGLMGSLFWAMMAFVLAKRMFNHFIVRSVGV